MSQISTTVTEKQNWFKRHPRWTVVIIVVFALMFIGALGDSQDTPSTTETTTSEATETKVESEVKPEPAKPEEPKVPVEYTSALNQADSYANNQHMSKQGLYDQLTSEYGGQFTAEAAQYAIDNVVTDWNANALAKAKSYQSQQSMSPAAIHEQLTSEYGEKFTAAEADYAIANLNQ